MLKIAMLLPNIYLKEINYLYYCFLMNSALIFWLSHMLAIRSCVILKKPWWKVRFYQLWFGIRILLLFISFLILPFVDVKRNNDDKSYIFAMNCTHLIYRKLPIPSSLTLCNTFSLSLPRHLCNWLLFCFHWSAHYVPQSFVFQLTWKT